MISPEIRVRIRHYFFYAEHWKVGTIASELGLHADTVAGLRTDLKARGLLDSTLVIWGGEFGRSPTNDGGSNGAEGRDHNPYGFTI